VEKNDRDMKTMQLENEVERLRNGITNRDERIEEMEKQRQQDRVKNHELKERMDTAERNLMEGTKLRN
jgi:hypothetical protein